MKTLLSAKLNAGLLSNLYARQSFILSLTTGTSISYMRKTRILSVFDIFNSFLLTSINLCEILSPSILGTILIGERYACLR